MHISLKCLTWPVRPSTKVVFVRHWPPLFWCMSLPACLWYCTCVLSESLVSWAGCLPLATGSRCPRRGEAIVSQSSSPFLQPVLSWAPPTPPTHDKEERCRTIHIFHLFLNSATAQPWTDPCKWPHAHSRLFTIPLVLSAYRCLSCRHQLSRRLGELC